MLANACKSRTLSEVYFLEASAPSESHVTDSGYLGTKSHIRELTASHESLVAKVHGGAGVDDHLGEVRASGKSSRAHLSYVSTEGYYSQCRA